MDTDNNNNILFAPNLNLIKSKALENMEVEQQNSLNLSFHLTFFLKYDMWSINRSKFKGKSVKKRI